MMMMTEVDNNNISSASPQGCDALLAHCIGDVDSIETRTAALRPLYLDPRNTNTNSSSSPAAPQLMHPQRAKVLSEDQLNFFATVEKSPLSVLWGPPGTGKTFTLSHLLFLLLSQPSSSSSSSSSSSNATVQCCGPLVVQADHGNV
jgi:hypothetical protein